MRAALCLLALCTALIAAQVAPNLAHSNGKARGDGFNSPISTTAGWKYYSFDVYPKNLVVTSVRPPNDSDDATQAGTHTTTLGELFNAKGEKVGVQQLGCQALGDDHVLGTPEDRVVRSLSNLIVEFGAADSYYDDTIALAIVSKRRVADAEGLTLLDLDAIITGGTGRFLGATGEMRVRGNGASTPFVSSFEVWVPVLRR